MDSPVILAVLACLAIVAEVCSVTLNTRGIRLSLSAAYAIVGAATVGWWAGPLLETLAVLTGALVHERSNSFLARLKSGLASILAVAVASIAFIPISAATHPESAVPLVGITIFVLSAFSMIGLLRTPDEIAWMWKPNRLPKQLIGTHLMVITVVAVSGALAAMSMPIALLASLALIFCWRRSMKHEALLDRLYGDHLQLLMHLMGSAHPYTQRHMLRVGILTRNIAANLGYSGSELWKIAQAGVLHDIGKACINEQILDKPGKLTDQEFSVVKRHPVLGFDILTGIPELDGVDTWVLNHHERIDGNGYPNRASEEEIPMPSRIIAVVDAFDAMTADQEGVKRSYRDPVSASDAIREIERCSGSQFDSLVASALKEALVNGNLLQQREETVKAKGASLQ